MCVSFEKKVVFFFSNVQGIEMRRAIRVVLIMIYNIFQLSQHHACIRLSNKNINALTSIECEGCPILTVSIAFIC